MNKVVGWIKNHQVAAFYIFTFAITWGLGFSYGAVVKRSLNRLLPLVSLASCGPALAGIIVSAVINTQPGKGKRRTFWIAFFVAWILSTVIHSAYLLLYGRFNYSPLEVGFRFLIVLPVAFVIGAAYSRIPEIKTYLSSLIRLQGVWRWVFLALVFYPVTVLLSVPISRILRMQNIMENPSPKAGIATVGWFGFKFVQNFLFFSATGEEAGWRGFALPRLQKRLNPLFAALVTVFYWMLWNIVLWQAQGQHIFSPQYWMETILFNVLASCVLVWFYNRSRGSILTAGVNHAALITTNLFFPFRLGTAVYLVWAIIIVGLIFADRMWRKLPSEHPAVYKSV
jgi:membrane protease YdiL (CAAX protease family)